MAGRFWFVLVALASPATAVSGWSAEELVLVPTLWSVPSVHPLPQENDPAFPLIAAAIAMPSDVTTTGVGSGSGVAALVELMLLAVIGAVWSTLR
jgi:hypothetical protein